MPDTSFLARTHALDGGARVRLRLARRSDAAVVRELLAARGVEASDFEIRRALSYDPVRRRVYCAFLPKGGHDRLVGFGAIDLAPGAEIETLVVDEELAPGLTALFGALVERRAAIRHRAA